MTLCVSVLGHGGGAPEAAMIGLPLLLFGLFMWLERRARRRDEDAPAGAAEQDEQA